MDASEQARQWRRRRGHVARLRARLTHLPQKLLDVSVDICIGKVEVGDDPLRLVGEGHGERAGEERHRGKRGRSQADWLGLGLGRGREEAGEEEELRRRGEKAGGRRQREEEQLGVVEQKVRELAEVLAAKIPLAVCVVMQSGEARIMGQLRGEAGEWFH